MFCVSKTYIMLFMYAVCCLTIIQAVPFYDNSAIENNAPVKIFYGLNESHSKSWAQSTSDGTIGITYFKITDEEYDSRNHSAFEGALIYKTISPDGTEYEETVVRGKSLEISVLLYDENSFPHIFVAKSNDTNQLIIEYHKENGSWIEEPIMNFYNEGGKFIYELSADIGPEKSFHLLALKTRSNPDSEDYYNAFLNSNLYHITNSSGNWHKSLLHNYDMLYTLDEYSKMLIRQDLKVDVNGYVHVIFSEQVGGLTGNSYDRLMYTTNKSGRWVIETAVDVEQGSNDSGGWYPSLAIDNDNIPYVLSTYIQRVGSGSAMNARLELGKRINANNWQQEVIAQYDDGYYGRDGRDYTGGLNHLVFDKENNPHIVFTDIASSHEPMNCFCLGNIRYGVKKEGVWELSTIYRQTPPASYYNSTEIYGLCILFSEETNRIQVVGQLLEIRSKDDYSCNLLNLAVGNITGIEQNNIYDFRLLQNYPNPFNAATKISYIIPPNINSNSALSVSIKIYDILGNNVATLVNEEQAPGNYTVIWKADEFSSGVYFCQIITGSSQTLTKTTKMVLLE